MLTGSGSIAENQETPNVASRQAAPAAPGDHSWLAVCALDDIVPDTGVGVVLMSGEQVALVRVGSADVYAISNFDPFSKAFVISRGIVGDKGGVPKIASPIYKQSFDLRTGQCLDDAAVRLPTWPVRVCAGKVEIAELGVAAAAGEGASR